MTSGADETAAFEFHFDPPCPGAATFSSPASASACSVTSSLPTLTMTTPLLSCRIITDDFWAALLDALGAFPSDPKSSLISIASDGRLFDVVWLRRINFFSLSLSPTPESLE